MNRKGKHNRRLERVIISQIDFDFSSKAKEMTDAFLAYILIRNSATFLF